MKYRTSGWHFWSGVLLSRMFPSFNYLWILTWDIDKPLVSLQSLFSILTFNMSNLLTFTFIIIFSYNFICDCLVWFGLVSLFNGISTFFSLFNAKTIPIEGQSWYYLTHSWENKGVHTFPKGICPKVNVIAWLEFKLAYYDSAVHRFNHYTTRTPPFVIVK